MSTHPWIEQTLDGRYKVVGRLGAGGMAQVLRAEDLRLERRAVAIKAPGRERGRAEGGLSDDELRTRFRTEIAKLIALDDVEGIVPIRDQGQFEGTPYYVMPLMEGGSLEDKLASGPQAPGEVLAWAGRIAAALDALHARPAPVLHRDVKPSNILFDARGRAHLTDFGIVKELNAAWATTSLAAHTAIGTPAYMAPEQWIPSREIDASTDQYALAATIYRALSGGTPAYERTTEVRARGGGPKRLRSVDGAGGLAHAPPAVTAALERALGDDQAHRFPSCTALVEAIAAALDDAGIATVTPGGAHGETQSPEGGGRGGSRRAVAWIGGLALLGVAAWLGRSLFTSDDSGSAAPRDARSLAAQAPPPSGTSSPPPAPPGPATPTAPPTPAGPSAEDVTRARAEADTVEAAWVALRALTDDLPEPDEAKEALTTLSQARAAERRGERPAALAGFTAGTQRLKAALAAAESPLRLMADAAQAEAESAGQRLTEAVQDFDRRVREARSSVDVEARVERAETSDVGRAAARERTRAAERLKRQWERARAVLNRDVLQASAAGKASKGRALAAALLAKGQAAQARREALAASKAAEEAVAAVGALAGEAEVAYVVDAQGRTALHAAAFAGEAARVQRLLDLGLEADATDVHRARPLHLAAWKGAVEAARLLLDAGAAVDAVTEAWPVDPALPQGKPSEVSEVSPAGVACLAGQAALLALLVERKADLERLALYTWPGQPKEDLDDHSMHLTLLHLAAQGGDGGCIDLLIAKGLPTDVRTEKQSTPLHAAAGWGRVEAVKRLLAAKADVEARNDRGYTPLHLAADQDAAEAVTALLDAGARIEAVSARRETALHIAAQGARRKAVEVLLERRARLNAPMQGGETPFHLAAKAGDVVLIDRFLKAGARLDWRDELQHTPLHSAIQGDSVAATKHLIDKGADARGTVHGGYTLIHEAAANNSPACIAWLLDHGWSLEAKAEHDRTPLHEACEFSVVAAVKALVERGANQDARTTGGWPPIFAAAYAGNVDVVRWLLDQGADLRVRASEGGASDDGATLLHIAASMSRTEVMDLVLKRGLEVDVRATKGPTPLHVACNEGQEAAARWLLDHGADLRATHGIGVTPLHQAALAENVTLMALLLGRGVPVDYADPEHQNPALMEAAGAGKLKSVKFLLENGANVHYTQEGGGTALSWALHYGRTEVAEYLRSKGAR